MHAVSQTLSKSYFHVPPTLTALVRAQGGKAVEAGKRFVPEVLYEGKYYPICTYSFDNNHIGATTFCKLLGFNKGFALTTWGQYDKDAMLLGKCMDGDELTKCTGGNNYWGDLTTCKKGSPVGVEVECKDPGVLICVYGCCVLR